MKIRNIKGYTDKEDKKRYKIGDIREVKQQRGEVIISKGYAVKAEEQSRSGSPE